MQRYYRIIFKPDESGHKRTIWLCGGRREDGWYFGRRINPKTLQDDSYTDKEGTIHDIWQLISPAAIDRATEYFEDMRYGGLTRKTMEQQRKQYGY